MGHPRRFERAPATSGFSRSQLSSPIRAREPRSEAAAAQVFEAVVRACMDAGLVKGEASPSMPA
jgi:hypothetical protein